MSNVNKINATKLLPSMQVAYWGSQLYTAVIGCIVLAIWMLFNSYQLQQKDIKVSRGLELQNVINGSAETIREHLLDEVEENQKQAYAIAHTFYCEGDDLNIADFRGIGESIRGRMASPHYPDTPFEVVYEQRTHWKSKASVGMYSFSKTKCMTQRPLYTSAKWQLALKVTWEVLEAEELGKPTLGITHYFARYIPTPDWALPQTCEFMEVPVKDAFHAFFRPLTAAEAKECRAKYAEPVIAVNLPKKGPLPAIRPAQDEVASLILAAN